MRCLSAGLLWFCLVLALPVAAQSAPDPEQQRRLTEQKLKLVEMLVMRRLPRPPRPAPMPRPQA